MGFRLGVLEPRGDSSQPSRAAAALLRVSGLADAAAGERVREQLQAVPGVLAVRVHLEDRTVRVSFDSDRTPVEELLEAISRAGDGLHAALLEATW